jgi:class 3 adenylate cyclase
VLGEYHEAVGDLVHRFEGTLERFTGDGLDGLLQRPRAVPDAPQRACGWRSRSAAASRSSPRAGAPRLRPRLGIGVAQGHATLGRIGFEGRSDYAAIGSVTNLAARLCARRAGPDPDQPARARATEHRSSARRVGELELRGFSRPARVSTCRRPRPGRA